MKLKNGHSAGPPEQQWGRHWEATSTLPVGLLPSLLSPFTPVSSALQPTRQGSPSTISWKAALIGQLGPGLGLKEAAGLPLAPPGPKGGIAALQGPATWENISKSAPFYISSEASPQILGYIIILYASVKIAYTSLLLQLAKFQLKKKTSS